MGTILTATRHSHSSTKPFPGPLSPIAHSGTGVTWQRLAETQCHEPAGLGALPHLLGVHLHPLAGRQLLLAVDGQVAPHLVGVLLALQGRKWLGWPGTARNSPVQWDMARYSPVQGDMSQYGPIQPVMAWYGGTWPGTACYGPVQWDTALYCLVQPVMAWYCGTWPGMAWYSRVWPSTVGHGPLWPEEPSTTQYCQAQPVMALYGPVQRDTARYGPEQPGTTRYCPAQPIMAQYGRV